MTNPVYFTHPGVIHADETAGYATLLIADMVDSFDRSGDLSKARFGVDFVSDTGGIYSFIQRKFDHHQGIIQRENGVPYAAFGLIWNHYGRTAVARVLNVTEYLEDTETPEVTDFINQVAERVDLTLVQGIDAADADNQYKMIATCSAGEIRPYSLSQLIGSYNSENVRDAEKQDEAFQNAAEVWKHVIVNSIKRAAEFVAAKNNFQPEIYHEGKILVLDKFIPWQEIVAEQYPDAIYIAFPGSQSPWSLQAVPVEPGSRELKNPLERPEWFEGFIHNGKFIAGCESKEEAVKLASSNF